MAKRETMSRKRAKETAHFAPQICRDFSRAVACSAVKPR